MLVHMIDGTSPQPVHDFEAICNEMALFNPTLAQKPQVRVDSALNWFDFITALISRELGCGGGH